MLVRNAFIVFALSALATPAAWAIGLSLEGVANYSTYQDNAAGAFTHPSKLGLGLGAELEFMVSGNWGVDFGGLYLQRKYGTSVPGSTTDFTTTQQGFEFPFLVRYWVGGVVSFGLGGYYFKYTGNITQDVFPLGGGSTTTTASYGEAQQTPDDYGGVVSIRFDFPIGIMTGFVLDGRYEYGLKNNAVGGNAKFRDVTGIVGVRFGWMK